MKKKIIVLLLAALMIFTFAGCGNASSDMLIKEGTLMVACEPEYPPMEFKDSNGKLTGFDIEFATALGKQMGLKIEFVETGWDGIFMGLAADKYDCIISSVSITQERIDKKEMLLTDPYMNNGQFIVVRKGYTGVAKPEDLAGKKVGVQFATTADEACAKQLETTKFELIKYDTIQQAFLALEAEHVDAVVVDSVVAIDYVAKNPTKFEVSSAKLTNEPLGIAVKFGNDALQKKINEAIKALQKDGTLTKLSEKYMGADVTTNIDKVLK